MPLWVIDYQRGTRRMSLEAKGLYMDILIELWLDGDLPSDEKELSKLLNINPRTFKRIWPELAGKFRVIDGLISHSRVNEERLKMISKSEKNTINGRKGGKAKANAKANAKNSLTPKPSNTNTYTNTYTNTLKENKKENNQNNDPNFKTPKQNPEDVAKLTALATTEYKNTQFPHEVQPWIINLLGSVSAETLETAIKNAASYGNKDHKFRKNFSKMFESAEAVEEMAKMTAKKPAIRKNDVNIEDWN